MKKNKTSILFIDTHRRSPKPLQVPTHLVLHWRKYLLYGSILFILMGLLIGFLIYQQTSSYYAKKLTFVQKLKMKADVSKIQKSFAEINEYLIRVNHKLKVKGLEEISTPNAGGELLEISDINNFTSYYKSQLSDLEKTVQSIPIGRPAIGPITSMFGYRRNPFNGEAAELHPGIDFKGNTGDPVKVTAEGKVVHAGAKGGYGNCVIIAHAHDINTLYGHLSKINVSVGETIAMGTIIGKIGSTGRSTGPHLHYEIHRDGNRVDPIEYLNF